MDQGFKKILGLISANGNYKVLTKSLHGLERECLRIDDGGHLATTPHPKGLGSAMTNPYITTDFSEAQLELVTPPFNSESAALNFLEKIHLFVDKNLNGELIWPHSMPCILPADRKIPIAQYGVSREGLKKTLYRMGLSERYNRKMQTVSGTHYNFSFSEEFWNLLHKKIAPKSKLQDFISQSYLDLIRNFLRESWLNTYLFGASPTVDRSYFNKKHRALKKFNRSTYYAPFATSLRTSEIGYYSKGQSQLAVSFDDLENYIKDMTYAISTPNPRYKGLKGLNDHLLQNENEHYSRIRPKQPPLTGETPLKALQMRGIKYVEVRAVDINPFKPTGILKNQLYFLHIFLLYCLLTPSAKLSDREKKELMVNQNKVAIYGRQPNLKLIHHGKEIEMQTWAGRIIFEMKPLANLLDKAFKTDRYTHSLDLQNDKLTDPNLTPSAKIISEMEECKDSFMGCSLCVAKRHHQYFQSKKLDKKTEEKLRLAAEKSIRDQQILEMKTETTLAGYENMEKSTQLIVKEAKRRGVKVDVLDASQNFIRLRKFWKTEYVKDATRTSKDTYIVPLIMGNKFVTKQILNEHGIKTPFGKLFLDFDEAILAYPEISKMSLVIKPNDTDMGTGISFIGTNDLEAYKKSLENAFQYSKSVLVEQFIEGEEFRFLVIDYKLVGILNRIPANVIGDNVHTISELIDIKNSDPNAYKIYFIKKGTTEKEMLKSQKLTFESVLKKGQRVFLRKNSNIMDGGDPVHATDIIADKFKKATIDAVKSVKAKICGVDMIINKDNYAILELNFNPGIFIHAFPMGGKSQRPEKAVLDLLGF